MNEYMIKRHCTQLLIDYQNIIKDSAKELEVIHLRFRWEKLNECFALVENFLYQ